MSNNGQTTTAQHFTLSQAELAVLCRYLVGDDLELGQTAQDDLGVTAQQLGAAEAALLGRGWLLDGADGEYAVADEPAAVVATTIVPERLAIVRTSLTDTELPATHFSWAADRIVQNVVTTQGEHEFAVLAGIGAVIDSIIATSRLPEDSAVPGADASAAIETLVASMQALTMLMVVEQPQLPDPVVRNLSWLNANGALWLVDAELAARQQARRVDRAALRRAIGAAIGVPGSNGRAPV